RIEHGRAVVLVVPSDLSRARGGRDVYLREAGLDRPGFLRSQEEGEQKGSEHGQSSLKEAVDYTVVPQTGGHDEGNAPRDPCGSRPGGNGLRSGAPTEESARGTD